MERKKTIEKKVFSLDTFLKDNFKEVEQIEKPQQWIPLSKAFKEATGLPGIPMGTTTLSRGFSNTGKSTIIYETAVSCQNNNILPIIIDTENNMHEEHLELMGFSKSKPFLLVDNEFLIKNYADGANEASIEDLAKFINDILDKQEDGELPMNLCFLWDSIGSIDCAKSIRAAEKDTEANNMWNAGALEKSFKSILNYRIPSSKKQSYQYTNTFVAVQKIWLDNMQGAGVVKHKGGEAFFYGARLIIHMGGIQSHSTSKVKATKDKRDVVFGIETKIKLEKNQITGISFEDGKIISTPHGFIGVDKESIETYKKENLSYFRDKLGFDGEFEIKTEEKTMNESIREMME